jgi:hypothetical protein
MKYEIVDKASVGPEPRVGEIGALYKDLITLMDEEPGKKLRITFDTKQQGQRGGQKMAVWATEDGMMLFSEAIRNSFSRDMYLERSVAE